MDKIAVGHHFVVGGVMSCCWQGWRFSKQMNFDMCRNLKSIKINTAHKRKERKLYLNVPIAQKRYQNICILSYNVNVWVFTWFYLKLTSQFPKGKKLPPSGDKFYIVTTLTWCKKSDSVYVPFLYILE